MASRIVVVLSQSSAQVRDRRDLEEDIVGELLGAEGIELTIVPHLDDLDADGTGQLCLEGISTDMIVLSWLDPQDAHAALTRHGVGGRFGHSEHRDAEEGSTSQSAALRAAEFGADNGRRTIYHIDLRKFQSAEVLRKEVCRVRDRAAVHVVNPLQVIPHSPGDSRGTGDRKGPRTPDGSPEDTAPPRRDDRNEGDVSRSSRVDDRRTRSAAPAGTTRSPDEQTPNDELDELLDQFDNLEL